MADPVPVRVSPTVPVIGAEMVNKFTELFTEKLMRPEPIRLSDPVPAAAIV